MDTGKSSSTQASQQPQQPQDDAKSDKDVTLIVAHYIATRIDKHTDEEFREDPDIRRKAKEKARTMLEDFQELGTPVRRGRQDLIDKSIHRIITVPARAAFDPDKD